MTEQTEHMRSQPGAAHAQSLPERLEDVAEAGADDAAEDIAGFVIKRAAPLLRPVAALYQPPLRLSESAERQ